MKRNQNRTSSRWGRWIGLGLVVGLLGVLGCDYGPEGLTDDTVGTTTSWTVEVYGSDGQPVSGVWVETGESWGRTQPDGSVTLSGVTVGETGFVLDLDGYGVVEVFDWVVPDGGFTVVDLGVPVEPDYGGWGVESVRDELRLLHPTRPDERSLRVMQEHERVTHDPLDPPPGPCPRTGLRVGSL